MKVTAKRIDRDLTLQLHGELDHHGAKEVMLEIDRHLDVACRCGRRWIFPVYPLWTLPALP